MISHQWIHFWYIMSQRYIHFIKFYFVVKEDEDEDDEEEEKTKKRKRRWRKE